MRIIVNAISANTGGIVTYTSNLIQNISTKDVEVIVYVPAGFKNETSDLPNITIKYINVKRFFGSLHRFLWEQISWRKIIKDSGADVLYSSANYGVLYPPIKQVLLVQGEIYLNPVYRDQVLSRLGIKEQFSAFLRRNLMLLSAHHSSVIIFPSKVSLQAALEFGPNIAPKCIVNYLGVGTLFAATEEVRTWRRNGKIQILYISVFYPHKDPVTVAEATRILIDNGIEAKSTITMESYDFKPWPSSRNELIALQSERYANCVDIGRIDHKELRSALTSSDIFVFPSIAETFGFPLVEAMCVGIPLVVSDTPIHREICGDSALYFELKNPHDLAEKIIELDQSLDLRSKLSSRARERVLGLFTWEKHMRSLRFSLSSAVKPKPIRILINALHARTGGGITYLRNMLPQFTQDPMINIHLCAHVDQKHIFPENMQNITYHFLNFKQGFWRVLMQEQFVLPRLSRAIKADILFSPANYGPIFARNTVTMLRNSVNVAFVERRPIKLAYWFLLFGATLVSLLSAKRCIAVSNYANRVGASFLLSWTKSKVTIIPHGVNKIFCVNNRVVRDPNMLLAVSDIYVQKNFKNLLLAFSELVQNNSEITLKIAGRAIDLTHMQELRTIVKEKKLHGRVQFLGEIDIEGLVLLYQTCGLFVFPSTVETFGNPLVEAMGCGAPIISSNAAAMPEVLGDAGLYFDPNSVNEIRDSILKMLVNKKLRQTYGQLAAARSHQFSWEHTKAQTALVFKGV